LQKCLRCGFRSRVHGTIERTTGMLGVRSAARCTMNPSPPARRQRFSARAGSMPETSAQCIRIQPEPETRNGLSLARNDAFATITRSMLLPCSFASTPEISTNPFDRNSFAQFGFDAETGRMSTLRPVIRRFAPPLLRFRRSPLPFGYCNPPDQSVQPGSSQEARFA
jgi:hypothetical protein